MTMGNCTGCHGSIDAVNQDDTLPPISPQVHTLMRDRHTDAREQSRDALRHQRLQMRSDAVKALLTQMQQQHTTSTCAPPPPSAPAASPVTALALTPSTIANHRQRKHLGTYQRARLLRFGEDVLAHAQSHAHSQPASLTGLPTFMEAAFLLRRDGILHYAEDQLQNGEELTDVELIGIYTALTHRIDVAAIQGEFARKDLLEKVRMELYAIRKATPVSGNAMLPQPSKRYLQSEKQTMQDAASGQIAL